MTVEITPNTSKKWTCPTLNGPTIDGHVYAGPDCPGCPECTDLLAPYVMFLKRNYPHRQCFIPGHDHQMHICLSCSTEKTRAWHCPQLNYAAHKDN